MFGQERTVLHTSKHRRNLKGMWKALEKLATYEILRIYQKVFFECEIKLFEI